MMENNNPVNVQNSEHKDAQPKREEITVKFGKGLLGTPFTAKTGRECFGISVPNMDPADKNPWGKIVVPTNHVHENQFGEGMWMKLPADGQTKMYRSVITGDTPDGKHTYANTTEMVPNRQIKAMMDNYRTRTNEQDKGSMRQTPAQPSISGTKTKKSLDM